MNILINGIGVAGPTIAYWLTKYGHTVVLVDQSPTLRAGGYVVDFWGVGYDIAERMGLIGEIRRLGYKVREVRFVDKQNREHGGFGVDVFSRLTHDRFTTVRRSDISATIFRAIGDHVETMFADSVAAIEEDDDGVRVSFDHAPPRRFDLVVGADGLHSRVRRLAFGPDSDFEVPLGYHVAAFEADGYRPRDELVYVSYALPGRQASRFAMHDDKTLFLFIMRDEYVRGSDVHEVLANAFAGTGWEWPGIEKELNRTSDPYFDTVSQIRMPHWSKGRTTLVGDAAACVSLMAGEGTGLAMAEGYVLAGELRASGGDFRSAFARYEERLMPFLAKKQASAARFASSFAPKTPFGIKFRNVVTRLLGLPIVADWFIGRDLRDDIQLPDYNRPALTHR